MNEELTRRQVDTDIAVIKNELKHITKTLKVLAITINKLPCAKQQESVKNLWKVVLVMFSSLCVLLGSGFLYQQQKMVELTNAAQIVVAAQEERRDG
jgi:hypothetical protein